MVMKALLGKAGRPAMDLGSGGWLAAGGRRAVSVRNRVVRARCWRGVALAVSLALLGAQSPRLALAIPATPVLTLYRTNNALDVPFYAVAEVAARGSRARPAGSLAQGTSVIPCLVVRAGRPLVDAGGVPWVGFEVVVDSRRATRASAATFRAALAARRGREVRNHHCPAGVRTVLDARNLYAMDKAPWFDPQPAPSRPAVSPGSDLDAIVRAFHGSPHCTAVQQYLIGRRDALARAWARFAAEQAGRWPTARLERARHLDYAMRTALFEAHLGRGCSAYGACERMAIALSLRNRAGEACSPRQGCRYRGDIAGVAAEPSQYNIWDEYLTQISGLASCFLRPDLAGDDDAGRLQAMYDQSRPDIEAILFGGDRALAVAFAGVTGGSPRNLRHYYHPPAMGKCFPGHPRIEYMTGAVARRGSDFALIANRRVEVGARREGGFAFRTVSIDDQAERDVIQTSDDYPGFVLDARQVKLRPVERCRPYGTPASCGFVSVGRHRRVPPWLASGQPLALTCRARTRGESCAEPSQTATVTVGGPCDVLFQPVAGVP